MRDLTAQASFNRGNEVLHLRVAFQAHQFRHLHGAIFAHPAQIVAEQVGDHNQFSHFLGAGLEFVSQLRVAGGIGRARAGALDRPCLDL